MALRYSLSVEKITTLYKKINYIFSNEDLLKGALIHPRLYQGKKTSSALYERLEFLGDRVLALVIAEMLYVAFPLSPEGELAKRLTELVRQETLIQVAAKIGLLEIIQLMKGEHCLPAAVCADSCEALIGAMYLDGGLESVKIFIHQFWFPLMNTMINVPQDNKSTLQEWAQALGKPLPIYEVIHQQGPDHSPTFYIEVQIGEEYKARGQGNSKRNAEQQAALILIEKLKDI